MGSGNKSSSTRQPQEKPDTEDAIIERMNDALKKMMSMPHETQKELIERRRRQGEIKPRKK